MSKDGECSGQGECTGWRLVWRVGVQVGVWFARDTPVHTDRVHVNMSSINMYVGRERSSGLIKMTCYVTFL